MMWILTRAKINLKLPPNDNSAPSNNEFTHTHYTTSNSNLPATPRLPHLIMQWGLMQRSPSS